MYTDALILSPDNEDVLGCRSAVYAKLGMFNESRKDAESLISVIPQKPKVSATVWFQEIFLFLEGWVRLGGGGR